ncbi:hypothetical protein RQP46_008826 [Phenoliferia psychrophenolica]
MSTADASVAATFNGPILAAALVYTGLYGIAVCQAWDYFTWCLDDSWILKALVAWEIAVGSTHFAFIFKGLALVVELLWVVDSWEGLPKVLPNLYLWTLLVVEILTASVLCFRFRLLMKNAGDNTSALLSRFLFLSLRTSSATTAVALWERIADTTGASLQGQTPGLILAGVVLVSVLHTLNSRKPLRRVLKSSDGNQFSMHNNRPSGWPTNSRSDVAPRTQTHTRIRVDTIVLQEMDDPEEVGKQQVREFTGVPSQPFMPRGLDMTVESV